MSTYILIPLTKELLEYIAAAQQDLILEEFFKGIKVEIPQEIKEGDTLYKKMPEIDWRWNCESPDSPDGKCAYSEHDAMEDHCIYCGQPDERK